MKFGTRKSRRPPAVIIVALIDVLLVVLIFMMVTTTFKNEHAALKLSLPESRQSKSGASDPDTIILTIARQAPYYYLGSRAVTTEKLGEELRTAAEANPRVHLSIRGDEGAPFGMVVTVMDLARDAGIKSVQALTKNPEQE